MWLFKLVVRLETNHGSSGNEVGVGGRWMVCGGVVSGLSVEAACW